MVFLEYLKTRNSSEINFPLLCSMYLLSKQDVISEQVEQIFFPLLQVSYHDLTFAAHSCTAHQMEIFAQEFEPASYFLD